MYESTDTPKESYG